MPVQLPNELWQQIWQHVAPTPVQMGALRMMGRQQRDVLDSDPLWRTASPTALAQGQPLRSAFMARVGERSAQGNRWLAAAWRGDLRFAGDRDGTGRDYYTSGHKYTERQIMSFLVHGTHGRDDDFDAACAHTAGPIFWQAASNVLRNDIYIVTSAVRRCPAIFVYVGSGLRKGLVAELGIATLAAFFGDMPGDIRHDLAYARAAVRAHSAVYCGLPEALKANRELAQLHVACHPARADDTFALFGDDLDFLPFSHWQRISSEGQLRYMAPPQLRTRALLQQRLVAANSHALTWSSYWRWLADDAQLLQAAWRLADATERTRMQAYASPRLAARWAIIDTEAFLATAPPPAAPQRSSRLGALFRRNR